MYFNIVLFVHDLLNIFRFLRSILILMNMSTEYNIWILMTFIMALIFKLNFINFRISLFIWSFWMILSVVWFYLYRYYGILSVFNHLLSLSFCLLLFFKALLLSLKHDELICGYTPIYEIKMQSYQVDQQYRKNCNNERKYPQGYHLSKILTIRVLRPQ